MFAELVGQSVLVTEGAAWQRQRRMLMPAFTPRRVAGYADLMAEAAARALDDALPPAMASGGVDMGLLFSRLTMDAILRTLFGRGMQTDTREAAEAVQTLASAGFLEMFWPLTLPDWLPLPHKARKRRALRCLRALIGSHIAGHGSPETEGGDSMLSALLALREESTGEALSEQEVFDQCMLSFQAGHETSATALLWWSALLARHPRAAARAQEEVDRVLAGRTPVAADAEALPRMVATLKEAMRLYPPISALMTRRTTREITIDGVHVPARTLLRLTAHVLHHDARWFDDPEAFRPERFEPGAPPIERGAYVPFGLGERVCLGQHFAMLEMTIAAAMLLQRFAIEPAPLLALHPRLHVTLRPAEPVRLTLTRRAP